MSAFTQQQLQEMQTLMQKSVISVGDAMTRGQIPGFGSGMNDTYSPSDNVDATHPLNIRYIIAGNTQRLTSARLSFHLSAYRTYSNFTAAGTGAETGHTHSHSHSHNHGSHIHADDLDYTHGHTENLAASYTQNATLGPTVLGWVGSTLATTPSTDATANAAGSSGHTHTVSGSTFSGVVEAATAAGLTISFDGVDKTAALGGPWSVDVVELDVRPYLATTVGVYHTIALTPAGLGRIEAHLRLGAYVDARSTT